MHRPAEQDNARAMLRAMTTDDAPSAYGSQVADIIAGQARASSYAPAAPVELFIARRRAITALDQLEPEEHAQLVAMCRGDDLATLLRDGIDDFPMELEAAAVVDDAGALRYRLYGWSFGVIWLMPPSGLDVVAFASQHDLEHWHVDQRPIFWAMDRALARGGHGFRQPAKFCWWEERCWDEVADAPRGTVGSEPHLRRQLAGPG